MCDANIYYFDMDPNRSAQEFAREFRAWVADLGLPELEALDLGLENLADRLIEYMSENERLKIEDIPLLYFPTGSLNAWITSPTSKIGHYIVFDLTFCARMIEFIVAPQDGIAWMACVLRYECGDSPEPVAWFNKPLEKFIRPAEMEGYSVAETGVTYQCAIDFVIAHEYSHFLCGHLDQQPRAAAYEMVGHKFDAYAMLQEQEYQADQHAMKILSRMPLDKFIAYAFGIELMLMFWSLIESFRENCRQFVQAQRGQTGQPPPASDHPPAIFRLRRIRHQIDGRLAHGNDVPFMDQNRASIQTLREFGDGVLREQCLILALLYCTQREETVRLYDEFARSYSYSDAEREAFVAKLKPMIMRSLDSLEAQGL